MTNENKSCGRASFLVPYKRGKKKSYSAYRRPRRRGHQQWIDRLILRQRKSVRDRPLPSKCGEIERGSRAFYLGRPPHRERAGNPSAQGRDGISSHRRRHPRLGGGERHRAQPPGADPVGRARGLQRATLSTGRRRGRGNRRVDGQAGVVAPAARGRNAHEQARSKRSGSARRRGRSAHRRRVIGGTQPMKRRPFPTTMRTSTTMCPQERSAVDAKERRAPPNPQDDPRAIRGAREFTTRNHPRNNAKDFCAREYLISTHARRFNLETA
ncbi:hypothetical protein QE412_002412 [Microbacterium trichothecenolyticum]|uniref:Uncharacterized protein n=1 Tax=Microbacterium trichothecenolyticum TaxID=69370 RepID=A0ABU0TW10_MICTR|nr:hypothetical protein [Microbacterium trichothecenolyticum]